ncbi:MAG: VOC family protein [SAR202 cluster bacterium]|nr:VOC family protein [SAR202 cluster bacterium]MDP6713467.1 VOC family protein [SAR202 cluster bacterium]
MDFRYYGIAELAIVVSDIERAKEFYVGLLGFEATDYEFGKGSAIVKIGENWYLGLWEPASGAVTSCHRSAAPITSATPSRPRIRFSPSIRTMRRRSQSD